jgi:spermidine/putrescine transport system permease protein
MKRRLWPLLSPALLWTALFTLAPMLIMLIISFMQRDPYGDIIPRFQWENYARFFEPLYLSIFADTVILSLATTIICLGLGYPLAYYIANLPSGKQKIWLILLMIPFWINFLIRTYAWVLLLRNQGVVNSLLLELGWIDEPLQLLYTRGAVLLGMVYTYLPFMALPVYVAIERMDWKLLEAAYDLGATPWRAFLKITLPQTKSGIATGCVLVFISTMGLYVVTDILGGAKSAMLSNVIQNQFMSARDWPFGSALSVMFVLSSLILVILFSKAMRISGTEAREGRGG